MENDAIVMLTKADRFSSDCAEIAKRALGHRVHVYNNQTGEAFPIDREMCPLAGIISFLSPWIIPGWVLDQCGFAVNFHPGSSAYPGIGCYNFAIYEGAETFGAVCHHMEPSVDTGELIAETRFPILADETVETLKLRTMIAMSGMFADVLDLIFEEKPFPVLGRSWGRRPFTRKELNELCTIEPEMDEHERAKRIRATTYPGYPGPVIRESNGTLTKLEVPQRVPLA